MRRLTSSLILIALITTLALVMLLVTASMIGAASATSAAPVVMDAATSQFATAGDLAPPLLALSTEEPAAVVLSSFSAKLEGPSRALWTMSATALVVGFLVVVRFYPRK